MGSLPSSRLTKILQEKAELLKKRRITAEQALHDAETRAQLLEQLGVSLPESKEREGKLKDLVRRADWEAVETQARAYLEYLGREAQGPIEARRATVSARGQRLLASGTSFPDPTRQLLDELSQPPSDNDWGAIVEKLVELDQAVRAAESDYSSKLRTRALDLAKWSGESAEAIKALDAKFRSALEPLHQGHVPEAVNRLNESIRELLSKATDRRRAARDAGSALVATAKDLTVASNDLESTLQADAESDPIDWSATVPAVELANSKLADEMRERVAATIESLRTTLSSLREQGVDPTQSLHAVEEALSQVPGASPAELPHLLEQARNATEEPVVAIVAGLLDEVRPRLVEARRLGRDPSDVFAAMNRAREALRLKIYGEALAASQEAIDRVSQLTEELDTARDECAALESLLSRLEAVHFKVDLYRDNLERASAGLERFDLASARAVLKETVRSLGEEAVRFFTARLQALEKVIAVAKERGFLDPNAEADAGRIRRLLENGDLAPAGELLATLDVRLRTNAAPYVARRVEEIGKGFEELPDDSLVAPVRRLLADADVNLRVKEDLAGSLDSLRRAEREFSAVFAAHASSLVEGLEDERKALESMGGAGDEIQRQIDEVQQIFNMGDFVKASRASQEIRTRAHQQELVRSEEAISHAKLALVELGKMGLATSDLKTGLDRAQDAAHHGRYPEAYRAASKVQESATRLKTTAQSVLDATAEATELWQGLKSSGLPVDDLREQIAAAQTAYQSLDFDAAHQALITLRQALDRERAAAAARTKISEADLLVEDAQRLGLPTEAFPPRIDEAKGLLQAGNSVEAAEKIGSTHADLVMLVRPVLEENLRTIERDLDVARASGLETPLVVQTIGEARRRLDHPVPTGVEEVIERARSQLVETRGFVEHAERATKRAREALNEAELAHVDVENARARMERIESHLADREYPRVIELAGALERKLRQATYQQVGKTLASFQGLIVRGRQEGAITTLAENLLNQARTALDDGRPLEALQLATRSESELERVDLQRRIAQGSLESIEGKLGAAVKQGVKALLAQEDVKRARAAFEHHEYLVVLELAIDASDGLTVAWEGHRRAREALDGADRQVKEALEVGADVGEVMPLLEAGRARAESGDYTEATRRAREAAEKARWAIERLYTVALGEVRALVDTARQFGASAALPKITQPLEEAETALKGREWKRASDLLNQARDAAHDALSDHADGRWKQVEALYRSDASVSPSEAEFRAQARTRWDAAKSRQAYAEEFRLIDEETQRLSDRRHHGLKQSVDRLKEQVWVGEKLGLDTTPVMELLSEASLALESHRPEGVAKLVESAEKKLSDQVRQKLPEKLRDLQTELVFARDGLHVALGPIGEQLASAEQKRNDGSTIDAARIVLLAEEDLNRRKSMHRELLNLHYLIDAALGRASERKMDTTPARKLLDESIRARSTDYALALGKAREALALLQGQLKGTEPPAFWPFRRPPAPGA